MKEVSWSRQALLALSLFLLGTFAFWLEYKHKPAKESAEEQKKRVFSIQDASVKSISLLNGKSRVTLQCMDFDAQLCKPQGTSRWELLSPIQTRADDTNANSLLTAMGRLETSDVIDLKEEPAEKRESLLKEYGLDAESRKMNSQVEVVTALGTTILSIGQAHSVGSSVFVVRIDNGKENEVQSVYMIPSYFSSQISHDLSYWRDKKVVPFESHEVIALETNGQKDHFSGQRKDGLWVLKTSFGDISGDTEAIDQLLNTVTHLSAKNVVAEDKKSKEAVALLKDHSPLFKLSLHRESKPAPTASPTPAVPASGNDSVELTFYEKKSSGKPGTPASPSYLISSLSPVLYELDSNAISRFEKEVKDLRQSKLLTPMEQFTIRGIQLTSKSLGKDPAVFKDTDGKWSSSTFPELPQDQLQEKIQAMLDLFGKNKIQSFIRAPKIPSGEKEGLQVVLENDKGELKKKWVFWRKEGQVYARDLNAPHAEAYQLDKGAESMLPWEKDFFSKFEKK